MLKHLLLAIALGALSCSVVTLPPGNVPWPVFFEEPQPLGTKLQYLALAYLWPAILAFSAIVLFQLQFRMSMTGAPAKLVFSLSTLATLAMVAGLRSLAFGPNSIPAYVLGVALGYTVTAQLYAVRLRTVRGSIRVPWIVWRGSKTAVAEMEQQMAAMQARGPVRGSVSETAPGKGAGLAA